eukprot:11874364-Ditylum_brightwellii.AAC.1
MNSVKDAKLPQADLLPDNTLALQLQTFAFKEYMEISSTIQLNKGIQHLPPFHALYFWCLPTANSAGFRA